MVALTRPQLGTWPATQACALTGNRTGNPLICRPELSPLRHTSQGYSRPSSSSPLPMPLPLSLALTLPTPNGFLDFIYLFILETGEGREKEKVRNIHVREIRPVVSRTPPFGGLAHNPGMCSDQESNLRPLGLQPGAQSTEPYQPGLPTPL